MATPNTVFSHKSIRPSVDPAVDRATGVLAKFDNITRSRLVLACIGAEFAADTEIVNEWFVSDPSTELVRLTMEELLVVLDKPRIVANLPHLVDLVLVLSYHGSRSLRGIVEGGEVVLHRQIQEFVQCILGLRHSVHVFVVADHCFGADFSPSEATSQCTWLYSSHPTDVAHHDGGSSLFLHYLLDSKRFPSRCAHVTIGEHFESIRSLFAKEHLPAPRLGGNPNVGSFRSAPIGGNANVSFGRRYALTDCTMSAGSMLGVREGQEFVLWQVDPPELLQHKAKVTRVTTINSEVELDPPVLDSSLEYELVGPECPEVSPQLFAQLRPTHCGVCLRVKQCPPQISTVLEQCLAVHEPNGTVAIEFSASRPLEVVTVKFGDILLTTGLPRLVYLLNALSLWRWRLLLDNSPSGPPDPQPPRLTEPPVITVRIQVQSRQTKSRRSNPKCIYDCTTHVSCDIPELFPAGTVIGVSVTPPAGWNSTVVVFAPDLGIQAFPLSKGSVCWQEATNPSGPVEVGSTRPGCSFAIYIKAIAHEALLPAHLLWQAGLNKGGSPPAAAEPSRTHSSSTGDWATLTIGLFFKKEPVYLSEAVTVAPQ
eukprot:TRINITY_DN30321_c0_g1_i1.p1 TRINITY_DN30321_c0_g1~~TRINITY_DN30321_c0_g1_i1.p1  ORF type:complete len:595 (+),score=65.37 TRINITY_DN30321_c0_g1_i1:63-1847(+)